MATLYTQRLLVVVRASLRDTANQAAQVADPATDLNTFRVPLRNAGDAGNTTVAYWCSWTMTPEQRQRLTDEFGRRWGNIRVFVKGSGPSPSTRSDLWLFETPETAAANGYTPGDVLAALGMDRLAPVMASG